jgi:hypothetical protein
MALAFQVDELSILLAVEHQEIPDVNLAINLAAIPEPYRIGACHDPSTTGAQE